MASYSTPINASADGDNTIVAAKPGMRIRVLGYVAIANSVVAAQFFSGASSNNNPLTGPMQCGTSSDSGGLVAPLTPPIPMGRDAWFVTGPGQALILNLSSAVQVSGHLSYDYMPPTT
jgi:hypothetical protein